MTPYSWEFICCFSVISNTCIACTNTSHAHQFYGYCLLHTSRHGKAKLVYILRGQTTKLRKKLIFNKNNNLTYKDFKLDWHMIEFWEQVSRSEMKMKKGIYQ